MKLRHCCNLKTTPDFSDIKNLEELNLEGCVNLVRVHPSIGMLKRLVLLNLRDCKRLQNFPCRVEMDALQELNLSGCLNVNKLPQAFWSRFRTSIPGFIWNRQHPQRSVSLAGLHMLKSLNFSYRNLEQVPDAIGGLSFLKRLCLRGNNFSCLPGSLCQLSHLERLFVDGCKKLEVLPELPASLNLVDASDCTSLREVTGSSINPFKYRHNDFFNCPELFKNVSIDSEGSISSLDPSISYLGSIHQLYAFLGYLGTREFFLQDNGYYTLDIIYYGNNTPEWFTNRSTENHVKVELPSDWCYDKFIGYGTCVVFKCKNPYKYHRGIKFNGYSIKNFDGASMITDGYFPHIIEGFFKKEVIGIHESYMIWLQYTRDTRGWNEAKNFVTFSLEENNEDIEVKECGVRLICDEDSQQEVTTPSQHGGAMSLAGRFGYNRWSW